jgi:hypothetical protein
LANSEPAVPTAPTARKMKNLRQKPALGRGVSSGAVIGFGIFRQ